MNRLSLMILAAGAIATPAMAQDHSAHHSPAPTATPDPHAVHQAAPATMAGEGALAVLEPSAAAPPPPKDFAADAVFGAAAMARSRRMLDQEHGGARLSQVRANLLEYAARRGEDGYRWNLQGWYGGDINRLVVKTEGEGVVGGKLESAEVQLLYSRAMARYVDLQLGLRQDVGPGPRRSYLAAGFETLAPYWIELEGAAFLSDKGDAFARLEGSYDLRLIQRVVLQPRVELDFSAQDIAREDVSSGLYKGEFGLRLRYEIRREFAPYIGVSHARRFGGAADLARARGLDTHETSFVMGLRGWF